MQDIFSIISKIHDQGNAFIMKQLRASGVRSLVPSLGDILFVLYHQPYITMKELAEKIHKTHPRVTVLVSKLKKLQFILRALQTDNRTTYVTLPPQGKQFEPIFETISKNLSIIMPKAATRTLTRRTIFGRC